MSGLRLIIGLKTARNRDGLIAQVIDTAFKDGKTLFDAMSFEEIEEFIQQAKKAGLKVALAGSIRIDHMERIMALEPDIIGVRGAVCEGKDRTSGISSQKTREFVELCHARETNAFRRDGSV